MCGICGAYHYAGGAPVAEESLRAMTAVLRHRGPDDEGFYCEGPLGLGMRRLSIIDVAGGHQPIHNEDRTVWIVLNGEIYNFPDLRRTLVGLGHRFYTRSDTEVVVHAYEEWGLEALARLNGMFGLALWDARRERLVLARDPFGVKPLYFWDDGRRLLFGSELKAILADPAVPRRLDEGALDLYLTFRFVPSPRTLLAGIAKLQPGHCLVRTTSGSELRRFSGAPPEPAPPRPEAEVMSELRERLEVAVRRQLISDVPVGALLSGGVDSTMVVTLMSRMVDEPVHTFTVGFAEPGDYNELDFARETAKRLGTRHHEVVVTRQDFTGFLPRAMWHLEEPVVTPSLLPMFMVSKLAREHVKVVLTGQGADEPWAGYRRYQGERWAGWYQGVPAPVRDFVLAPLASVLPRAEAVKRATWALGERDPAERFARVYAVFTSAQKEALLGGRRLRGAPSPASVVRYWQEAVAGREGLAQMTYVDARFSLADDLLLYGDKMAMAASLEARVPMLDVELMAFVESLPASLRLRGTVHKYLYRKAIAAWLPPELLRRRKRGFDTPMDAWLKAELQQYAEDLLLGPGSACREYFDAAHVKRMLGEHGRGREDHRRRLFALLSFEIWHRLFIAGQPLEAVPA